MAKQGAFTMIELVMVIVILGVLAVLALPKVTDTSMFAGSAFHSEVTGALRYAQKSAVSHRRLVCATLTSTKVTLKIAPANPATACTTDLISPDGTEYKSRDPAAASVSGNPLSTGLFFQSSGTITTDGAGSSMVSGASGTLHITGQPDILIEGATGYVE